MTDEKIIHYDPNSDTPWFFDWMEERYMFAELSEAQEILIDLGFTPVVSQEPRS